MFRLLAACSVAVTLAACGGHAPATGKASSAAGTPSPTATPLPSVGSLRMVKPPVAIYHDEDAYLDVWVRVNRPIKASDISPDEYGDRIVSLAALEGESLFGASADVRFPTCYSDAIDVGAAPATGKRIAVELKLGPKQSLKATATVQHLTHDTHPARQLGCPRDLDGHICPGKVSTEYLTIRLETAYATSCDTAREVMTSVGRWANPRRCHYQLCVTKHRMNRGFRCDAYFDNGGEGPPAWQIECKKGRAEITAYADES
jgi:hypothetical protein